MKVVAMVKDDRVIVDLIGAGGALASEAHSASIASGLTLASIGHDLASAEIADASASGVAAAASVATTVEGLHTDVSAAFDHPVALEWESDAGRYRRSRTGWAKALSPNELRTYVDSAGLLQGVLMEPAETYHSAPFHSVVPTSSDPGYFSVPTGTGAIAYAGRHAVGDRLGGSGGGVLTTQGATPTRLRALPNLGQECVAEEIVRIEMIFHIAGCPSMGSTFYPIFPLNQSGSIPHGHIAAKFDTSGNCTFMAAGSPYRWGAAQVETIDGKPVYFVWWEGRFAAAGTVAPQFREPDIPVTFQLMMHEFRIIRNPLTMRPSAVPVLAAKKAFSADKLILVTARDLSYQMMRLARGRSCAVGGKIEAIPGYRSGPESDEYFPYESKIIVTPATETTSHDFIRPNPTQYRDFKPLYKGGNVTVYLAPRCYFNVTVEEIAAVETTATLSVLGVDQRNDQRPMIYRVMTNHTRLTNLIMRDVVVFTRSSVVTTQIAQAGIADLNVYSASGSVDQQRCTFASHTKAHSRASAELFKSETAGAAAVHYVGRNKYNVVNPSGGSLIIKECTYYRYGRSIQPDSGRMANPIAIDIDQVRHQEIYSDMAVLGRGTLSGTWKHNVLWRLTALDYDFYQSTDPVEVDIGGGRVDYLASGLASLPMNRGFSLYGKRAFAGQPIDDSDATRKLWSDSGLEVLVPYWGNPSSSFNKIGFQFNMSRMQRRRGWTGYVGIPGKSYPTWADLVIEAVLNDGDMAVVAITDTGKHKDPYSRTTVLNRGTFRYLQNYGWVRLADATPYNSGTTYTDRATIMALPGPFANGNRALTGAGEVFEYQSRLGGWQKIADHITLPVYASTPGRASPTNPHIYLTVDAARWTGATERTTLTQAAPVASSSGTHGDFFQLNVTTVNLLSLAFTNNVCWGEAQGPFLQMSAGANRSVITSAQIAFNIIGTRMPNVMTVINLQAGASVSIHDNFAIFADTPYRYNSGNAPNAHFLIGGRAEEAIAFNNWMVTPEQSVLVSGGGSISQAPRRINQPRITNMTARSAARPVAGLPVQDDVLESGGDNLGFADLRTDPRTIRFTTQVEKISGIPLNTITTDAVSGSQWSFAEDRLLEIIASQQRDPDHVLKVSAATPMGTVVASGLAGSGWDPDLGGAELGHFTFENGAIKVAKALTGLDVRWLMITEVGELVDIDIS